MTSFFATGFRDAVRRIFLTPCFHTIEDLFQ